MPWKILIVDDDVESCANLSDILTDFGHEVCTAHNARDALQQADEQRFDIVLLDLQMPGIDGVDLYRELKRPAERFAEHEHTRVRRTSGKQPRPPVDQPGAREVEEPDREGPQDRRDHATDDEDLRGVRRKRV